MKTLTNRVRLVPHRLRGNVSGMTLIELLVGMVLALFLVAAIYQVLSIWDSRRRTITGVSSAQITGGIGVFELERDLQLGGMGFGNASENTLGCTVSANNSSLSPSAYTFTMAPIEIVDGASGAPDVVRVLYGNSAYVVNIQKLNSSTAGSKTLQFRAGFNAGDLMVVASGTTTPACELFQVTGNAAGDANTVEHGTANFTNFYTASSATATFNVAVPANTHTTGEVYNMGPAPQLAQWSVGTGDLLTRQNTLVQAASFEVTDGIVNLQAQYGIDADNSGKIEASEWVNTAPAAGEWKKLLAVRVAILARSGQFERDQVTTAAPKWAGGDFTMTNLDGTAGNTTPAAAVNNWKNYRYRVYESIVPLRNMLWGFKS